MFIPIAEPPAVVVTQECSVNETAWRPCSVSALPDMSLVSFTLKDKRYVFTGTPTRTPEQPTRVTAYAVVDSLTNQVAGNKSVPVSKGYCFTSRDRWIITCFGNSLQLQMRPNFK